MRSVTEADLFDTSNVTNSKQCHYDKIDSSTKIVSYRKQAEYGAKKFIKP